MHPRISLHQVAFLDESTVAFLAHCRDIGVQHATLVTPVLTRPGELVATRRALEGVDVDITSVNHPFAIYPDLDHDMGLAAEKLNEAIDIAAVLGAPNLYLLTGARGSLDWESAANRFGQLLAPCRERADAAGVQLLVENASPLNADIHIAHTLHDTITLAETAGIGICIDLHACWPEAALGELIGRALPRTGLIQVSDYVLGDRAAPCRAVPGDGVIPLQPLLAAALRGGYHGMFDIELLGPRIDDEGARAATERAAQRISEKLTTLGA